MVAIDLLGDTAPSVEEGDTLRLRARAVDARGDSVPDAAIVWERLDPDTGQVPFAIDAMTGLVTGLAPGSGRVQARVESLRSGVITVTVTAAPDSIALAGPDRVAVAAADTASPALVTALFDLTTSPGDALALGDRPVHYEVVEPPPGGAGAEAIFLAVADTATDGSLTLVAATDAEGQARAVVRRRAGATPPDSAVVRAVALTARGDTVSGSPVPFVVLFETP